MNPPSSKNFLEYSLERRQKMSNREMHNNEGCIPLVILSAREWRSYDKSIGKPTHNETPKPVVKRFLINRESKMFQAITTIQKQWKMTDKENGVFMYTRSDEKLVNSNATVG